MHGTKFRRVEIVFECCVLFLFALIQTYVALIAVLRVNVRVCVRFFRRIKRMRNKLHMITKRTTMTITAADT